MSHYKKTLSYGKHQLTLETGEIARQSSGAVMVSLDDTVVLVTVVGRKDAKAGPGLFPADRRLPGTHLCRGQDPRRFLQTRRPSQRKRDSDFASDRPSAASAVSGKFLQRSADRGDRDVVRSANRFRHSFHDRCFRRTGDFRHPVRRPYRRCARGLPQRPIPAESDQG